MSKLPFALLLLLCVSAYPQSSNLAHATYGRTGQMVGLADLAPLRDCRVRSADGNAELLTVSCSPRLAGHGAYFLEMAGA